MRGRSQNNSGFGLVELMISMALVSVLLLGAYKLLITDDASMRQTSKDNQLLRQATQLEGRLRKGLRNAGFNPTLKAFPMDQTSWQADRYNDRMGLILAGRTKIDFTSDDNANGQIDPGERTGFLLALDHPESQAEVADVDARFRDAATGYSSNDDIKPCTANSGLFEKKYKLYSLSPDPTNPSLPTKPVVLADNVVCFELRYYTWYVPYQKEPEVGKWRRIFLSDDGDKNPRPNPNPVPWEDPNPFELAALPPDFGVLPQFNWDSTSLKWNGWNFSAPEEQDFFAGVSQTNPSQIAVSIDTGSGIELTAVDAGTLNFVSKAGISMIDKVRVGYVLAGAKRDDKFVNQANPKPPAQVWHSFDITLRNTPWDPRLTSARR